SSASKGIPNCESSAHIACRAIGAYHHGAKCSSKSCGHRHNNTTTTTTSCPNSSSNTWCGNPGKRLLTTSRKVLSPSSGQVDEEKRGGNDEPVHDATHTTDTRGQIGREAFSGSWER